MNKYIIILIIIILSGCQSSTVKEEDTSSLTVKNFTSFWSEHKSDIVTDNEFVKIKGNEFEYTIPKNNRFPSEKIGNGGNPKPETFTESIDLEKLKTYYKSVFETDIESEKTEEALKNWKNIFSSIKIEIKSFTVNKKDSAVFHFYPSKPSKLKDFIKAKGAY